MDPQQRILLEISWEALENAGIDPTTLTGTAAGVYFSVVAGEYGRSTPPARRSLTAIHLAVRALRAGECSIALAGGANVVCAPSISVGFARLGALAPDGLSKPFSARSVRWD